MYRVFNQWSLLHDTNKELLQIHQGSLELEIGHTGTFEFTIYPEHPYYGTVELMKPGIKVYQRDNIIFSGRAIRISTGLYHEKVVTCEGALSYLLDSMIAPDYYYGNFYGYMERLISVHNAQVEEGKQFTMGVVNIPDFDDFEVTTSDYLKILDALNTYIADTAGGTLTVRYADGVQYLDVVDYGNQSNVSTQAVKFGKNLVDLQQETDGSEVFTSIIPLGDEVNGVRVGIGSVNDWVDYITNEDAVAQYGLIHKVVVFEGITDPQTLKDTATEYFDNYYSEITNIEISVADTAPLDESVEPFRPGQWVNVYDPNHFEVNPTLLLVKKISIAISEPKLTKITVGRIRHGITQGVAELSSQPTVEATVQQQKILWSGGYYMTSGHTITLSEKVSEQTNGIVLIFSRYSNATNQNYHWNHFFVSKEWVRLHGGTGCSFILTSDGLFGIMGSKYLYIHDDKIGGNDVNNQTGTAATGITYNNAAFVLRYVIGV